MILYSYNGHYYIGKTEITMAEYEDLRNMMIRAK